MVDSVFSLSWLRAVHNSFHFQSRFQALFAARCSAIFFSVSVQAGDSTALLLVGIARQVEKDYVGAAKAYHAVLEQGCRSEGKDIYAHYLLSQLRTINGAEAAALPDIRIKEPVCNDFQVCLGFGC
jgi:hypothetical protein